MNILWIVIDCLRADHCAASNVPGLKAWPRLCESGTCFEQALCTTSTTPTTFASMLTGLYPFSHGVISPKGPAIGRSVTTVAELFREQGYATHAFMTGPLLGVHGHDRGFSSYEHRDRTRHIYSDWGSDLFDRFRQGLEGRPWMTMLHFFELHRPIQTDGKFSNGKSSQQYVLAWKMLDEQLDRLLNHVPDNTIVVLTGDHGEELERRSDQSFVQHGIRKIRRKMKMAYRPTDYKHHGYFPFDTLHHVPLVISGPGIQSGRQCQQQVRHVDIMPTLLDLTRISPPEEIHGRSLMPLLKGGTMPDESAYLYTGWNDPNRAWHALRADGWKYIEKTPDCPHRNGQAYLFDLRQDPGETINLVKKHPETASRMQRELNLLYSQEFSFSSSGPNEIPAEEQKNLENKLSDLGYI